MNTIKWFEKQYDKIKLAPYKIIRAYNNYCQDLFRGAFLVYNGAYDGTLLQVFRLSEEGFNRALPADEMLNFLNLNSDITTTPNTIDEFIDRLKVNKNGNNHIMFQRIPMRDNDFKFYFIFVLNKTIHDSIPRVNLNKKQPESYTAFAETMFIEITNRLIAEMFTNDERRLNAVLLSERDLLESATSNFLEEYVSTYMDCEAPGLFSQIETISRQYYESKEAIGTILFTKDFDNIISLEDPLDIGDYRRVRKLLELTDEKSSLVSNGKQIIGIISDIENEKKEKVNGIYINFREKNRWRLDGPSKKGFETIFNVIFGCPQYTELPVIERLFVETLKRVFPDIKEIAIRKLIEMFYFVKHFHSGGILIIDKHAAAEADRLKSRGFRLKECDVGPKMIMNMCKVDGAVILDSEGNCHALGVILDGFADEKSSDSSRGSRYNSTVSYVLGRNGCAMGCVFSIDGNVDILPRAST